MSNETIATDALQGEYAHIAPLFEVDTGYRVGPETVGIPYEYYYEDIDSRPDLYGPVSMAEKDRGHCDVMSASAEDGGCNVAILVDEGTDFVDVCIYDSEDPGKAVRRVRLTQKSDERNALFGFVPDMKPGDKYRVRPYGKWDPENRHIPNPHKAVIDPYARAIGGEFSAVDENLFARPEVSNNVSWDRYYLEVNTEDSARHMPYAVVVDPKVVDTYDWEGDTSPKVPEAKTILYEAHVKDMTMQHPDVPEHLRGTYAGMASEPIIKHLQKLGITSVELMPVQHFVSDQPVQQKGRKNHWGYQTLGYFAPHGEYSSAGQQGEQINEFRDMVKALHAAGIEVIMDVVYNHTAEGNEHGTTLGPKALFNRGFYLHGRDGRMIGDPTGCGNTISASSPIAKQLIMDSLRYWVKDMHVDGFRFDLAATLALVEQDGEIEMDMESPILQALENDPELSETKIYAEPWFIGANMIGQYSQRWNGEWSGFFRDLSRDFCCRNGTIGDFVSVLGGGYLPNKNRPVHFVTAHDGFTLADVVSYNEKHNEANGEGNSDGEDHNRSYNFGEEGPTDDPRKIDLRKRAAQILFASMFVSPGSTPMISHGDEIGRTQGGNNNAYCQDNKISWLDWNLDKDKQAMFEFSSAMVNFRKEHPVFERPTNPAKRTVIRHTGEEFRPYEPAWVTDPKIFGLYLSGRAQNKAMQEDDNLIVIPNGTHHDLPFQLPDGGWEIVVNSALSEVAPKDRDEITVVEGKIAVPGLSMVVVRQVYSNLPRH